MEKIETKTRRPAAEESAETLHFPSKSTYNFAQLYGDLMRFSAKHLRMGGRLVFWIPIYRFEFIIVEILEIILFNKNKIRFFQERLFRENTTQTQLLRARCQFGARHQCCDLTPFTYV